MKYLQLQKNEVLFLKSKDNNIELTIQLIAPIKTDILSNSTLINVSPYLAGRLGFFTKILGGENLLA